MNATTAADGAARARGAWPEFRPEKMTDLVGWFQSLGRSR